MTGRPEQVASVLKSLESGVERALGSNLAGVYLRGSLALGDFDPETSDIDFLVVTNHPVSDSELVALEEMHAALAATANVFASHLEGSFIDRAALRRFQPGERLHPTIGVDWALARHEHRDNWILERWVVRERGVTLRGPDPQTHIEPISADERRAAVRSQLQDRIRGWAADDSPPAWLMPRNYQAFEVETMCRALYTLAAAELPTKPVAVAWGLRVLPEPWRSLVERSQLWRADATRDPSTVAEVVRFVRWAGTEGEATATAVPPMADA